MPPSVPLNHYFGPKTNRTNRSPFLLFHARTFKLKACLEHFDLFKVNMPATKAYRLRQTKENRLISQGAQLLQRSTASKDSDPTTSFLTAAMTIYTLRAGITAAAGTRLALS
jgi:hypothetical protein